jgi:ABC-type multidrug transport system fused ATPase/permease subunit
MHSGQTTTNVPYSLVKSPWRVHLARHAKVYLFIVLLMLASVPTSLALVVLAAYAFRQLQAEPTLLPWVEFIGEHAARWVKPFVRGTDFEQGIPLAFQTTYFPLALLIVGILTALLKMSQEWLLEDVGERISLSLRQALAQSYAHLPFAKANALSGAALANAMGEDAREVRQAFTRLWGSVPADGLLCLFYAAFLCLLDTQLFVLLVVILLPAGLVIRVTGKSLKKWARQGLSSQAELLEAMLEKMRGWQTIKILGGKEREISSFNKTNNRLLTVWRRSARAKALSSPLVEWLGILAGACVVVLALRRISDGALTSGVLTAFLVTIGQLANASQSLTSQLNSTRKGTEALRRAHRFLVDWRGQEGAYQMLREPLASGLQAVPKLNSKSGTKNQENHSPIKTLEAKDLSIGLAGQPNPASSKPPIEANDAPPTSESHRVLAKNLNFSLQKGDFALVTGPSGAGKSTLLRVVLGLEEPLVGAIKINQQLTSLALFEEIASEMAFFSQEPFLLEGNVLENVMFPEPAEPGMEARVRQALARAQLENKNLNDMVSGFSGGERQRLMFARAFFREASLWVLDEATSALDSQTEARVLDEMEKDKNTRIVLMVAHRSSLSKRANFFIPLESHKE